MDQGLLSGIALAVGYGIGICAVLLYRFLKLPEPTDRLQRISKRLTTVVVVLTLVSFLRQMTFWQNSIRQLMEMEPLVSAFPYRTALIAVLFGMFLIAAARFILNSCFFVSKKLNQLLPRRISIAFRVTIVGFTLLFLVNGVLARALLNAADAFFVQVDGLNDEGAEQPTDVMASGSNESLIAWNSIGRHGKTFVVGEPTQVELSDFWGQDTRRPVRVYVGMRSSDTKEKQARLALDELIRVGGFERSLLVVATPTGKGWIDPSAVDTLEYLHGGDTAIVGMQYCCLPSWLTTMVHPERPIRSARILFDEIYGYWKMLPKESRPKLYLHGLSLGSLGSEVSAPLLAIFEDPIQGAVWSGPPFPSTQWSAVTKARNPNSPAWLPRFRDGALIRFTAQENALDTGKRWGPIRNVYIQYASDPMVFFSPDLLFKKPQWLIGERAPDVSPHLTWYPIVTFLQIACDLPVAHCASIGYGHNYSPSSYIDAWIAVTQPKNWTAEETARLKELFQTLSLARTHQKQGVIP